jgi:ADP-heptose:LPS heptosyltransferase
MASGQARAMYRALPRKVFIYDRNGAIREHEAWRGVPYIGTRSDRPQAPQVLRNAPGFRPYIAEKTERQWTWLDFVPTPAEIVFAPHELAFAEAVRAPGIVLEPNNKAKASPNKDWGFERWMRLAAILQKAGHPVSQLGPVGTRLMPGVKLIETPDMRHAAAVLARAGAAVLPEGGLHHTAAALGVPAVVIFGGFISPRQTGYAGQVNLFTGGAPCGMRIPCKHCADAMAAITPEAVAAEVEKLLAAKVAA